MGHLRLLNGPMNGRGWKFWRHNPALGAVSPRAAEDEGARDRGLPDECARCSPLLTALFDGEASEAEIRQARRHLLSCGRCAQTWLGWNQTRVLLLDQIVPKTPPTLVGRIRLACGIAGKSGTPDLHAQILARTSRQNLSRPAQPKPRLTWPRLSSSTPVWGATALGALVLLLAHDSLSPIAPPAPLAPSQVASETPAPRLAASNTRQRDEQPAILPWKSPASSAPPQPRARSVASSSDLLASSDAERTLVEAKRERESLASPSLRREAPPILASLSFKTTPLPRMSAAFEAAPRRVQTRAFFAARRGFRKMSSPAPAPKVLASQPIVLASASAALMTPFTSVSAPFGSEHRVRLLLASVPLERASLRISTPRVRPITVGQDFVSDDAGLEDLDSTVQQYRSSLSDDSDPGGTG